MQSTGRGLCRQQQMPPAGVSVSERGGQAQARTGALAYVIRILFVKASMPSVYAVSELYPGRAEAGLHADLRSVGYAPSIGPSAPTASRPFANAFKSSMKAGRLGLLCVLI